MVEADEKMMRQYLLGELAEAEMSRFEERLMTEDELFEMLMVVEDELIDERASDGLSSDERARFDTYFLSTPARRQRLELARALRDYARRPARAEGGENSDNDAAVGLPTATTQSTEAGGEDLAPPPPVIRPARWASPRAYLGLAAAAIIVIAIGIVVWLGFFRQSDVSKGLQALNQAYREQRPTEARITGFDYAPLIVTRGGKADAADKTALNRAERILLDEAAEHPASASYHALGKLYLAEGRFDEAIAQFEKALLADANNAQLHSDLGAALLQKGEEAHAEADSGKGTEIFARSLEQLTKAIELNGSLNEARFNRALLFEKMMLPHQAEDEWRTYLKQDPDSKWAAEARTHLQQIEDEKKRTSQSNEEILRSFISAYQAGDAGRSWVIASQNKEALSGRLVSDQLLNAYLDLSLKGQHDEAKGILQGLRYLANLESERGDGYTLELTRFYASRPQRELERLMQAQRLMASGKSYYTQGKPDQAIEAYGRARQLFTEAGDKCETLLAGYWIAYAYPDRADAQRSKTMFEQLARESRANHFKWLLMRTVLSLSAVHFALNNYSRAVEYASAALDLATQMSDTNGSFNAWSYLIEYYRYLGNYAQALYCVQRSLPLINTASPGHLQRIRHYGIIASAFNSAGLYSAAISFQQESLALAKMIDNPVPLCVAYAHLGMMYGKLGNYAQAVHAIELAYDIAGSCPDESVRQNQRAYAALQMAHVYRQAEDFPRAIENYDASIEIYTELNFPAFSYLAHKGRLVCYIAQGDDALAGQELQATIDLIEKYRSTITEADNRNSFFDGEQSVYDLAINFAYARMNDPQRALEYSEASRARSLLDLLTTNAQVRAKDQAFDIRFREVTQPLSLADIEQRLPDQVQILQYAVLPDKLIIWAISKAGCATVERAISQDALADKVRAYLTLLSSPSGSNAEELLRRAKELFDIVVAPAESLLDKNKSLCIVADKILSYLPFATLVSGDADRYLIEDYPLTYSPSATVFVLCSERAARKSMLGGERLLSVGNPRFDRQAFPLLPDLPAAGKEAEGVAVCYRSASRLVGSAARKSAVKSEMERADVIHLALHAIVDERSPLHSRLVLAKEPSGAGRDEDAQGVMEVHELYGLKLPQARLVVLSACQTGADRYYKGEGMISIARPFIVAGVPLVIASLWPVDSDSTAELMISFHRYRKQEKVPTAEALRRAQRDMLARPESRLRSPYCWAAFTVIGGYTSY